MLSANLVIFVCLVYVALLFAVAFLGDLRARKDPSGWLSSPLVYTLSISIYCTSWTFFGAVGSAATTGLEFATIYLGPTILFVGWWIFMRKLVAIGRINHTTSIADFVSARFGKSPLLGAAVTLVAVIATTPYIALQLKALTASFQVVTFEGGAVAASNIELAPDYMTAFWLAAGLCLFSIIFGVRNIDVNERHHGVIAAIAVEAVVKLVALVVLGLWVVFSATGLAEMDLARAEAVIRDGGDEFGARWITLLFLAGSAVICLPRQFQVTVVENSSEDQLRTASWLFPLYLFLICIFVIPIANSGLVRLPAGSNPDLFVLTLPLEADQRLIGMLAILGGFSSATSMVIVSSIALSTMISNHIVMPLRLAVAPAAEGQSLRRFILGTRRASIVFTVMLGFLYFRLSGNSDALAAIGLVSFCGVAQFLPSVVAGLYWRRATPGGAFVGLAAGFLVWGYTLFLPSFESMTLMPAGVMESGPFGWSWLKPHALFGLSGLDPLVHAVFWSMFFNAGLLVAVSLLSEPSPLTRLQSTLFIDVFRRPMDSELRVIRRTARIKDLRQIADRILGSPEALKLIQLDQSEGHSTSASDELIRLVEQRLAANVGASAARSLLAQVIVNETISVEELKRLANEAEQIRAYSAELESKSRQLERTAEELAGANRRLRQIDLQKNEFLSQVSHEVRTPMTSIRSFSEILLSDSDIDEADRRRFIGVIQNESIRLTRLLDGILDLNLMEAGEPTWETEQFDPDAAIEQAIESCEALAHAAGVKLERLGHVHNVTVRGNKEKLAQVFINLISNAIKYNTSNNPRVTVSSVFRKGVYEAHVMDNGPGIAEAERERIFLKFARGAMPRQRGAGLGLAISRQIVERLGGSLSLRQSGGSGCDFVVRLNPAAKA